MSDSLKNSDTAPFLQLVDDILVLILCKYGNIPTVLSIGSVNRKLHDLSLSKQIWLFYLSDLRKRYFIDCLPDNRQLEDLSAIELIAIAKRAVVGPKSWAEPDVTATPPIAHQVIIDTSLPEAAGQFRREYDVKLVPGGRLVLLSKQGKLECWEVNSGQLVWQYVSHWHDAEVHDYAVETVEGGEALMIFVCIHRAMAFHPRENHLEVLRLDLKTYRSTSIVTKLVPGETVDNPFNRALIEGDFAFAFLYTISGDMIVLVQISTGSMSVLLLRSALRFPTSVTLSFGHIIALYPRRDDPKIYKLAFWSVKSVLTNSQEVTDIESIEQVACVSMEPSLIDPDFDTLTVVLEAIPSPLHLGSSILWASFTTQDVELLVYKFCASYSEVNNRLSLTEVQPRPIKHSLTHRLTELPELHNTTFAGYTDTKDARTHKLLSLESGQELVVAEDQDSLHISLYSGIITYATSARVVVNYYE